MAHLTFFHNLSADTVAAGSPPYLSPRGYLVAPQNATGRLRDLAAQVASSRRDLVVDNGNFSQIGKIRSRFRDEADELVRATREVEDELGRSVRRGELPDSLVQRYDGLDRAIRHEARRRVLDDEMIADAQDELTPERRIGAEDITMAAWLSLDIEHRFTSRRRRDYRRMNERVAARAASVAAGLDKPGLYYPVASAVSFNTAYDAGVEFARAGLTSISMGFGAFMADNNFVDHVMIGRRRIDFVTKLPYRYVRTIVVINGFWSGYRSVLGRAPGRFHFLGLGAPIMIPPVALAAAGTTELSFDATSPIKDATRGGTLYVDKPALLKIRTRKVAHRLAREPGHTWSCPCPFCVEFIANHPFDYQAGHRWHATTQAEAVTAEDLRPAGALFAAYPLLSEPSGGPLRGEVNFARIGHNHWILERTMTSLERAERDDRLATRVTNMIHSYQRTTSPPFANALQVALDLSSSRPER